MNTLIELKYDPVLNIENPLKKRQLNSHEGSLLKNSHGGNKRNKKIWEEYRWKKQKNTNKKQPWRQKNEEKKILKEFQKNVQDIKRKEKKKCGWGAHWNVYFTL